MSYFTVYANASNRSRRILGVKQTTTIITTTTAAILRIA